MPRPRSPATDPPQPRGQNRSGATTAHEIPRAVTLAGQSVRDFPHGTLPVPHSPQCWGPARATAQCTPTLALKTTHARTQPPHPPSRYPQNRPRRSRLRRRPRLVRLQRRLLLQHPQRGPIRLHAARRRRIQVDLCPRPSEVSCSNRRSALVLCLVGGESARLKQVRPRVDDLDVGPPRALERRQSTVMEQPGAGHAVAAAKSLDEHAHSAAAGLSAGPI